MGRGAPTSGQAVVALCGYSRVGKDTAAARLLSSGYQLGSTGERFAELLREINPCLTLADHQRVVTVDALFAELGYDGAKSLPAVRTLMQDTGSAIKARQPDFFIRRGRGVRGQRHLRLLRQTPPRLCPDDRRRHRRVAGRGSRLQP